MKKIIEYTGTDTITLGKIEDDGKLYPPNGRADRFIYDITTAYSHTIPLLFPYNIDLESTIHPDHTNGHITWANNVIQSYIKLNKFLTSFEDSKQLIMAKTLLDMDRELQKHSVEYFLCCGTLLGAYREGSFIKGDTDIDLGMVYGTNFNFPKKFGSLFLMIRQFGTKENGFECTYQHQQTKINVDIFLWYPHEKGGFWYASYTGLCDNAKNKMCRWKCRPFTLGKLSFLNKDFRVPEPVEQHLEDVYGINWNVPKSFGYYEGMNEGHYHGLVLSDFDRKDVPQFNKKEVKKSDIWPRKVRSFKKPIIWMYWQNIPGKTKPPYLNLCMKTVQKACGQSFEIILLNDDEVESLSRSIHKSFRNIEPIAMRADYIRFTIVSEYGGIWLDADILVLRNLLPIANLLSVYNFIGFQHDDPADISIGIFAGNPLNKVCLFMKYIIENEFGKWKKKKHKIPWAVPTKKLGKFVSELKKVYPDEYHTLYAPETVYPVDWKKSKNYFWSIGEISPRILNSFYAVYLHNEMYDERIKTMSEQEVLRNNFRISKLFSHALREQLTV